jgi:hypothetical protein
VHPKTRILRSIEPSTIALSIPLFVVRTGCVGSIVGNSETGTGGTGSTGFGTGVSGTGGSGTGGEDTTFKLLGGYWSRRVIRRD